MEFKPATTKDKGKVCAMCGHVIYVIRKQARCMCDNPKVYQVDVTKLNKAVNTLYPSTPEQ